MSKTGARVVPLPVEEFTLHGHLAISHSCVMSTSSTLKWLVEVHAEDHEYPGWLEHPHVHSDPEPESEWSWE